MTDKIAVRIMPQCMHIKLSVIGDMTCWSRASLPCHYNRGRTLWHTTIPCYTEADLWSWEHHTQRGKKDRLKLQHTESAHHNWGDTNYTMCANIAPVIHGQYRAVFCDENREEFTRHRFGNGKNEFVHMKWQNIRHNIMLWDFLKSQNWQQC